jgi:hypothetical protein
MVNRALAKGVWSPLFVCVIKQKILYTRYMDNEERITYFAQTDARGKKIPFGIKAKDRSRHMYVIGKTGMGKSTLLENMAVQDIRNGEGLTFMDPHGSAAEKLLDYIPEERIKDVLYFAPFDLAYPISFNVLENVDADKRHFVVNGLMSTFEKIWADAWSARMAYILQNTLMALLEYPDATLLGVNRMYIDKDYRKKVISHITDPSTRSFWVDEYSKFTDRYTQEATPAIQNKIGQFSANALVRNIIGQPTSAFDTRDLIDSKKIFIVNLSKGRVGEGNANLLGSMLITKLYLAALSRADSSGPVLKTLPNHYLYVDEFQSFANRSFADILSEARKYKLNLLMAHQYVEQMEEEVRSAVFGNVGTMVTFRVGAYDSELLEKELAPVFFATDVVNLGFAQIYLKLMIDGVSSQPFSATTLPPLEMPESSHKDKIIAYSRKTYAEPRDSVEEAIRKWHEPVVAEATSAGSATKPSNTDTRRSDHPSGDRQQRSGSERSNVNYRAKEDVRGDRNEGNSNVEDKRSNVGRENTNEAYSRTPREHTREVVKAGEKDSARENQSERVENRKQENRFKREPVPQIVNKRERESVVGSSVSERKTSFLENDVTGLRDVLRKVAEENAKDNQTGTVGGVKQEKSFSDKDRADLRAVVTHALKDSTKDSMAGKEGVTPPTHEVRKENNSEQKSEIKGVQNHRQEGSKSESPKTPKEIPEDELKKMMHVDR